MPVPMDTSDDNVGDTSLNGSKAIDDEDDVVVPPPPLSAFIANADGSRLIITKIVNENFKSYAGVQILGPFHKYFTAIIGPNGSGKSNVIDSMLFVFGYRASKIRSTKLSALLHDSPDHGKARSCTVTIHFASMKDKPDELHEYELVANSEFYISRTANADSTSHYTINGKRASIKEVELLLGRHGIDLVHNRFLILQGEVEQISLLKPKGNEKTKETGMLEYLEDVIGSSRFKEPIEKLEKRVGALSLIKDEKRAMFTMAVHDLDALQAPFEVASNYIKIENQIALLHSQMYQKKIVLKNEEMKEKAGHLLNLEKEMKQLKSDLDQKAKDLVKLEQSNKEKLNELEQLGSEKDKLKAKFDAFKEKDVRAQQDIARSNKKRNELIKSLATEEEKKIGFENKPATNQKTIDDLEIKEVELQKKQKEAEEKQKQVMASVQADTVALQAEKDAHQNELSALMATVNSAKAKNVMANTELSLHTSRQDSETKKLDDLKAKLEAAVNSMDSSKGKIEELNHEIQNKEVIVRKQMEEATQLKAEEREVDEERRKCQISYEEAQSSMQSNRSRGKVLDALMRAKQTGQLPGVYGRMGDLGGIDQKYDVAISTAASALDHIVVDSVDTAEACIMYLKTHNIGRASFLGLDKVEHLRNTYSRPFQSPENAPRLFDLIQVADERMRPAFYHALRDTLVANNLEQASRIAYGEQRYRVVTLAGELIETAGTMSGGGKQVFRGRMGRTAEQVTETVSPQVIEAMGKKLKEHTQRLGGIRKQLKYLDEQIAANNSELAKLRQRCNALNTEFKSNKSLEPTLRVQITAQESKVKDATPDPHVLNQLQKDKEMAQKELEKATKAAEIVEVKVKKIHAEILAKTKGKLEDAQKKVDAITTQLETVGKEKTKLRVDAKKAALNLKKCQERIANIKEEIANCVEKIKRLADETTANEAKAKEALTEFENVNERLNNAKGSNQGYESNLEKIFNEKSALKSREIDLKDELRNSKSAVDIIHVKINSYKKSLKALKLTEQPYRTDQLELKQLSAEELEAIDLSKVETDITKCQETLPKRPNLGVIPEYIRKREVHEEREKALNEAAERHEAVRNRVDAMKKSREIEFNAGLKIIGDRVKECYQMLAEGGDAGFEVANPISPFADGIRYTVRPPKKAWRQLEFLSGGEKTLASLAIIFALHAYKPAPLYFMDEIDSALDWKNTAIVGYYLKEQTRNAQFIVVSLRENMFEIADQLIGIYKTFNCTKTLCIIPGKYGKDEAESRKSNVENSAIVPVVPSSPPPLNDDNL